MPTPILFPEGRALVDPEDDGSAEVPTPTENPTKPLEAGLEEVVAFCGGSENPDHDACNVVAAVPPPGVGGRNLATSTWPAVHEAESTSTFDETNYCDSPDSATACRLT